MDVATGTMGSSAKLSDEPIQALAIKAADGQTSSVLQEQHGVAVKQWLPFLDSLQVYERRSADAQELSRHQPRLRRVHGFAQQIGFGAGVQADVIPLGFDPIDFSRMNESDATGLADHHAVPGLGFALQVFQEREQPRLLRSAVALSDFGSGAPY